MTKVKAVSEKAVVTLRPAEDTYAGGLVIPETHRKSNTQAVVVSSGIADVEVGDVILLSGEYAGASFSVDKVEYITVVADEILAVIESDS